MKKPRITKAGDEWCLNEVTRKQKDTLNRSRLLLQRPGHQLAAKSSIDGKLAIATHNNVATVRYNVALNIAFVKNLVPIKGITH